MSPIFVLTAPTVNVRPSKSMHAGVMPASSDTRNPAGAHATVVDPGGSPAQAHREAARMLIEYDAAQEHDDAVAGNVPTRQTTGGLGRQHHGGFVFQHRLRFALPLGPDNHDEFVVDLDEIPSLRVVVRCQESAKHHER